jgi:hypothetical protein
LLPFEYLFGFADATIFSNPPLSRIVLCNESGSFEYIETDEYGFNNPRALWDSGKIDIMMLGDSFAEGHCVPHEARLAEVVRAAYPRMLNLGRGGLGPLGELALLREYGRRIAPRIIVWCYYDNDLDDLAVEARVPTLARYLHDHDFTQNLYARRDEVNRLVTATVEQRLSTVRDRERLPFRGTRHLFNNWAPTLRNPRLVVNAIQSGADVQQMRGIFLQTMQEAQRVSRSLGAELLFVYVRGFAAERPGAEEAVREHPKARLVRSVIQELGIPMLDLADAVRARYADPRDMHRLSEKHPVDTPGNMIGHYNVAGYRFAGEVIAEGLRTRFPELVATRRSNHSTLNDQ